jgi:hypothetical protein
MDHLKGSLVGSSMSTKCNLAIVRTDFHELGFIHHVSPSCILITQVHTAGHK